MPPAVTRSRQELVMDVIFGALRVKDASLNEGAAALLTQLGTAPVSRLVREAATKRNSPSHRLRALTVITRIGQLSCENDFWDLNLLANDRKPEIRDAAYRAVQTCRVARAGEPLVVDSDE